MNIRLKPGRLMAANPLLIALLLSALALTLSACGFQPRGTGASLERLPHPLQIEGLGRYKPLRRELRRQLTAAGHPPAAKGAPGGAALRLEQRRSERRVLSVNRSNKVVEYELEESVRIGLLREGEPQMDPQTIRVIRILYRPSDAVLSSDHEEDAVRDTMRRDLADRILRRIARQY